MISGRTFTIVGGVAVDEAFLARLARDRAIVVSLHYPGGNCRRSGSGAADSRTRLRRRRAQVPLIRAGKERGSRSCRPGWRSRSP